MDIHDEASRIASQQKDKAARDAAKVSEPVELKVGTAASGNPAIATDAAKVSEPAESKADAAVSGNPASDAA